ncbi:MULTISPECIES: hypothetical protein [unclassified Pseudomonas]|uniref:hypothetical protein n=1 Tax=unclassified Pseudomonas TaxID=196821 RepID=UPI00244AFF2A|nr:MULTISPECIES: hypothetical protein [unclassified Pseudomonas]MDG9922398.1 hypothetical protein [Pseudomonas sp. GD04045]MDH0034404.1 hypothetical protein [Pseudomonas sp. GD04019]
MKTNTSESPSVVTLYELLTSVASGRTSLPTSVLSSQSSLANYSDSHLGIYKSSLNTLKAKANSLISGGFQELDGQRRKALIQMQKRPTKSKTGDGRTKLDLEVKITSLKSDILSLEEDLLTFSVALDTALSWVTRNISDTNNQLLIKHWSQQRKEILTMLSLRNRRRTTFEPQ